MLIVGAMKIALLHETAWPEPGGVQNVMRDQAAMLVQAGHEVTVLAGLGAGADEGWTFRHVPALAPDFPLNKTVRSTLERGQFDQSFNQYRSQLTDALDAELAPMDLTLVHNAFTVHHNLALTRALHDLAPKHRLVAWTHDLAVTNPDVTLPNPGQAPWSLMRAIAKDVTYVATSDLRSAEMKINLRFPVAPRVIPDMVDPARLFGCTPEVRRALPALELPWRDFIFLLPARVTMRKNLEFAIEIIRQLQIIGRNPLLLITGGPMGDNPASAHYAAFLKQSMPAAIEPHVIFVSDYFPVTDAALRDLYLLSDCVIYPSRHEGFGLPVIEAAMHRMPVWCFDVPAYRELEGTGTFLLKDAAKLPEALQWLESQSAFRQQRRCRRLFDPVVVYSKFYDGFFRTIPLPKT